MSRWFHISRAAHLNARTATDWYVQHASTDVAADFLAAVEGTYRAIRASPLSFRRDDRFGLRRAHLHRFPYKVSFEVDGRTTTVLALTHDRLFDESVEEHLRAD